jgi:hypothetical protein
VGTSNTHRLQRLLRLFEHRAHILLALRTLLRLLRHAVLQGGTGLCRRLFAMYPTQLPERSMNSTQGMCVAPLTLNPKPLTLNSKPKP